MATINTSQQSLDNQIISLDKILPKYIKDLTFKEVISLIFHSVLGMSKDANNPQQKNWQLLYEEFETENERQNNYKWPKLTIIKNDQNKRIDVSSINKLYIKSDNFFTHLFRLLCVENYKRTYNYKSYGYHKILNHTLKSNNDKLIKHITLDEIFSLFERFMEYYLCIYNNSTCDTKKFLAKNKTTQPQKCFEYLLAKTIIKKL